jgi:hypothetical protein
MLAFASTLKQNYFGNLKTGLISLQDYVYEELTYIVKLYPSIKVEPMFILYLKKHNPVTNNHLIILNQDDLILGTDQTFLENYPYMG